MLAFGGFLSCTALLALAALMLIFRGPDRPDWTRSSLVEELATIGVVYLLAFGLGYLAAGAIRAYEAGPNLIDAGAFAGMLVVFIWIWRRLEVRKRLRAPEVRRTQVERSAGPPAYVLSAGSRVDEPQPAPTEPPPPKPTPPTRRAA